MHAPLRTTVLLRDEKVATILHALKHLGIGYSATFGRDEVTISAGDGRIAIRPDGTLRQAILDEVRS
jgi:hypothetical protein